MAAGGAVSGASALFTDCKLPFRIWSLLRQSWSLDELERQFLDSRCSIVLIDEYNLEKVMKAAEKCARIKVRWSSKHLR